jgi:hypothetical protein
MLLALILCLTMVAFAVWLRLAVRWVDRHGVWGGQYRPPERAQPTKEAEAPPG